MSIESRVALRALLGGSCRRMAGRGIPADLLLEIESGYVSDDGSQAPLRGSEGLLTSPGIPSGVEGCIPDWRLMGFEDDSDEVDDDERGFDKPVCRRPAPVMGVRVGVIEEGPGCCKTDMKTRRMKQKWYKKNRKMELRKRKKFRTKYTEKVRDKPGGVTHEKRKVYRPRNYPNSIQQPEKGDPREVRVVPHETRKAPRGRWKTVEKTQQVKQINT